MYPFYCVYSFLVVQVVKTNVALAARLNLHAPDDTGSGHSLEAFTHGGIRLIGRARAITTVFVIVKDLVIQVGKACGVMGERVGDAVALVGVVLALPLTHAVPRLVGRLIARAGGKERGKRVHVVGNAGNVSGGVLEANPRLALNQTARVREIVADEVVQLLVGSHGRPLSVPCAGGATYSRLPLLLGTTRVLHTLHGTTLRIFVSTVPPHLQG